MTQEEILALLSDGDLASFLAEPAPDTAPKKASGAGWMPDLNPTQKLIWDDPSNNILFDGEKGSGKSIIGLHKLVRHAYEVDGALCFCIVTTYNVGDMGCWHDLQTLVLPAWRGGNRYPDWIVDEHTNQTPHPQAGELSDSGMGLEYTESKMDPKTKASKIWIGNRFNGWSLVVLLSIPFAAQIEMRVKGPAPSYVYVEELTNCESRAYHSYLSAQLGRRRGMRGAPQQFTASCNPAGPSHWVYKLWFEECIDDTPNGKLCPDGLRRKPSFSRYHVRLSENVHRLPIGYAQRLLDAFPDSVDRARLLEGQWVDRATGKALYGDYWVPAIHVKGDVRASTGLQPRANVPVIVGYDPGPVNFSIHFLQLIATKDKGLIWIVFDELNFVGMYVPYHRVIPAVMRTMQYWHDRYGPFAFEHISDEAAFNQRKSDGSFDNMDIERLSRKWCAEHPDSKLVPIKLRACPKGPDTVPARSRMIISMLQQETLFVSATCKKTVEMFSMLESEDPKEGKHDPLVAFRPKRSIFVHPNDSMSYPLFYFTATGRGVAPAKLETRVYECGSR